jgi:hypothetical protein
MTSTVNAAREALYQAFHTAWAGATPIAFENEDYKETTAAFVRFSMRNEDAGQNSLGSLGNRTFDRVGRIFVQIFTPLNVDGMVTADTLAESARAILEGTSTSGVHIYGVSTREVGPDGKWFYTLVEAPFTYYTTK